MKKLNTIWLPRGRKVYVSQGMLVLNPKADDQLVAISQNNTRERKSSGVKQSAFLLQEMEETNNWARMGARLYFGWFALILAVNTLALIWLFTYRGVRPPYARLVFLLFIGMNLTGTIMTYFIRKHMLDCDRRIKEVLAGLHQHHESEGPYFAPRSPVPRPAVNIMFAFTGMTLFMLLLFWVILEIWPHVFLT